MGMKENYLVIIVVAMQIWISRAQLSSSAENNPYSTSCPRALSTIKAAVYKAILNDRRMGASLLRLHFHDCFGCDASVLLDDSESLTGEKTAGPNMKSLRGFEVIDSIKSQLETLCPGVVSCADILAVAARDSVVALSGPNWAVELGRRDSTTASLDAANSQIPSPFLDVADLISAFSNKGAHTIGQAKCSVFRNRIYNESNIHASFATSLKSSCPFNGSDDTLSPIDASSPLSFDTAYFKNLVSNRGLLHSDQQLFSGASTDSIVTDYTNNPPAFFADFATAMIKMGGLTPLTGTNGQIRTNCRKIN
ncbi:Peroxidase superfamily protein [Perilla frutescens var. frutescens]|nr:Peroxidase superfamily protein [Perilla frutescens var. frutescens]